MSVTGLLHDRNSPLRKFLREYEDPSGVRSCLVALQSDKPIQAPDSESLSSQYFQLTGTAMDYLLRYTIQGQSIDFAQTIANMAVRRAQEKREWRGTLPQPLPPLDGTFAEHCFAIGRRYLDGRAADDPWAVRSALALALLDHYCRSAMGDWPESIRREWGQRRRRYWDDLGLDRVRHELILRRRLTHISVHPEEMLALGLSLPRGHRNHRVDRNVLQNRINALEFQIPDVGCAAHAQLEAYRQAELGGPVFIRDLQWMVRTFRNACLETGGVLEGACLLHGNVSMSNAIYVLGADIDSVIEVQGQRVLTEFKTSRRRLTTESLRQLLCYALLVNPKEDGWDVDAVGVYHVRSGSYRTLPVEQMVSVTLPGLGGISHARKVFVESMRKAFKFQSFSPLPFR